MVKWLGMLLFVWFFISCSSTNNKPVFIGFSKDRKAIIVNHIDQAGLLQLKNTPNSDSVLRNLISVLQTPSEADTAIKEEPIDGKIKITDNTVVFTPFKPFVKGRDYLVITWLNMQFGDAEKMLKGQINYDPQPLQKLLTR